MSKFEGNDVSRFRISQDYEKTVGVKKLLTTVPVRKPDKQWFVRAHSDPKYQVDTMVIELKEDRETYVVEPELLPELHAVVAPVKLVLSMNRQKVPFLWQLRLPSSDGKINPWHGSALEACERAKLQWVKVGANMSLGAYETAVALGELDEPQWPDLSLSEIFMIAFKGRIIDSLTHPVVQMLRGER